MAVSQGRFVWYELMTTDTAAAKAFYGKVVGWGTQDGPVPGLAYTLFTAGEMPVGGLMDQPEDARKMGAPPSWIGYVAVDDVDATTERVKRLGGTVHVPPRESLLGHYRPAERGFRALQAARFLRGSAGRTGHAGPRRLARTVGCRLGAGARFL